AGAPKAIGQAVGALVSLGSASGVEVERTAALLVARREHIAALGGEDARRRGVDVAEEDALHASEQETYPAAALADGSRQLGRPLRRAPGRREVDERSQRARQ